MEKKMKRIIATLLALAVTDAYAASNLPLNPEVTQETIYQTICQRGYTKTVRPPVSYTNQIKIQLMQREGLPLELMGDKKLDHVIPLAAGGSPDDIRNLRLEDSDESYVKDRVEVCLSKAICAGTVSLAEAQRAMWSDWRSAARLCN
jgi:hypothetical protein